MFEKSLNEKERWENENQVMGLMNSNLTPSAPSID
jgi:hypothetical protein